MSMIVLVAILIHPQTSYMKVINDNNLYPENSFIRAKVAPETPLIIVKYLQQIYYCAEVAVPNGKQLAYFERELLPPATA
jgi:hypothetical protein